MARDQASYGAFRQVVGIDSVEGYVNVLGIGRQAGKRSILPALTLRDCGFGVIL